MVAYTDSAETARYLRDHFSACRVVLGTPPSTFKRSDGSVINASDVDATFALSFDWDPRYRAPLLTLMRESEVPLSFRGFRYNPEHDRSLDAPLGETTLTLADVLGETFASDVEHVLARLSDVGHAAIGDALYGPLVDVPAAREIAREEVLVAWSAI